MANLTIVIDDQLLQDARVRALREGTSVNEICRQAIARYAQSEEDAARRARELVEIAGRSRRQPGGPAWKGRAAFYEEILEERFPSVRPDAKRRPR